eukprot:TRINITY_DN1160_c0_g1_i1.p1 TRINITY_DN1160_c0_g1~~TRINITY_DN1160_c0_g1_i1.p1  ORF type:complete len:394 (+),score=138.07 TRINITY_DN1160_c0_g1_i1:58-1239(+)
MDVDALFYLKRMRLGSRSVSIILQNSNGPCPLIALANALALQGRLNLREEYEAITTEDLLEIIRRRIEQVWRKNPSPDMKKNASDCIEMLPNFLRGMDVNVRFKHTEDFEYTEHLLVFDILGIILRHGWIPKQTNPRLVDVMGSISYNQAVEIMIELQSYRTSKELVIEDSEKGREERREGEEEHDVEEKKSADESKRMDGEEEMRRQSDLVESLWKQGEEDFTQQLQHEERKEEEETEEKEEEVAMEESSTGSSSREEEPPVELHSSEESGEEESRETCSPEMIEKAMLVESFLSETSGQMTIEGLREMYRVMREGDICVLFKNNHFSTIKKVGGYLYELVTDMGLAHVGGVAWSRLCSVVGDNPFYDENFVPLASAAARQSVLQSSEDRIE